MKFNIPKKVVAFEEGKAPTNTPKNTDDLIYEPSAGQKINVLSWIRYPAYDFIFGVPDKSSIKYELEASFLQFRDTRGKKVVMGMYLDVEETQEFISGMSQCLEYSKTHSPHLWKNLKTE